MAQPGERISDHDRIEQIRAAVAALLVGVDQIVAGLEGIVDELSPSAQLTLETALVNYRNARLIADVQIDTLMSQAEPVPSPEA
jgi:hypothetical protein